MDTKRKYILVVGMSGAGKTTYSNSLSSNVLHFDDIHNYADGSTNYAVLTEHVKAADPNEHIVVDAWRLRLDPRLEHFMSACGCAKDSVEIHFIYTNPLECYIGQLLKERAGYFRIPDDCRTLRSHAGIWSLIRLPFVLLLQALDGFGLAVKCVYRSPDGYYVHNTSWEHALEVFSADPVSSLLEWIAVRASDPMYQTIEIDGETICKGYTDSEESWNRIQKWGIDWKGKRVCDIGCFHGYYSFKAEEAGASVVGYDRSSQVCTVANRIGILRRSMCRFVESDAVTLVMCKCDIALLMNVLHHIVLSSGKDAVKQLVQNVFLNSNEVVLEINDDERDIVNAVTVDTQHVLRHVSLSHRVTLQGTRRLLHYAKSQQ